MTTLDWVSAAFLAVFALGVWVSVAQRQPTKCPLPKPNALVLALPTIETAPKFFSLLALILRASRFEIWVLGGSKVAERAAQLEIPFTHFLANPPASVDFSAALDWKHAEVTRLRQTRAQVIWIDLDFNHWPTCLGPLGGANLVTLNWEAFLNKGATMIPKGVV